MHAFLAYFDTFFTPTGAPAEGPVSLERFDESLKIDGRPGDKNDVSFTTGVRVLPALLDLKRLCALLLTVESPFAPGSFPAQPKGVPTHWKQTVFILKEPFEVTTGASASSSRLKG